MNPDALAPTDFAAFFRAVWGFDPFPWQIRLLLRLATGKDAHHNYEGDPGRWPDVLDLPTGSGKTAALDIAVFHLALEVVKKANRRAPVRIAFVVDRRLIVDDVYERARHLAEALRWSLLSEADAEEARARLAARDPDQAKTFSRVRAEPIVKQVAQRLCDLAGPNQPPLLVRSLRGGAPLEDDWARTPVQPTILCSTVDQVGSRLMFRGYGVSDRMKPIHAGLLGSDCLILLDEAHLSEPFRQTLTAIEGLRKPDRAPFEFAVLTATPAIEAKRRFELGSEDRSNRTLLLRISAAKPTRLVEIAGKQGVDAESRRVEEVAAEAKAMLTALQDEMKPSHPAIGVVLNRVARARGVFERLRHDLSDAVDLALIIGPARGVDREKQTRRLMPIRTGQDMLRREMTKPLVVVATQTIEAGVDIDFDGLVTEAAAFDALRQRFGRLNRAGREITAKAVVLAYKEDINAKADDPVYGDRIRTTWDALNDWAGGSKEVEFGILAMEATLGKEPERVPGLLAPTLDAPVLMPAYADLWSQTSPIPNADPDIALFLHGPNRSPASVQIVWRADINQHDDLQAARQRKEVRKRLIELFSLVPPRAAEAIEVPLWAARAFLRKDQEGTSRLADVAEREPEETVEGLVRPAFRWAGKDSNQTQTVYPSELRPGDLIVVPAAYRGCDEWGWNPGSDDLVADVADVALWPYRTRQFVVRLTPELITQGFHDQRSTINDMIFDFDTTRGRAEKLCETLGDHAEDHPERLLDAVLELRLPQELTAHLNMLRNQRRGRIVREFAYGDREEAARGVIFIALRGLAPDTDATGLWALPATETEDLGSVSDQPLGLFSHCEHVSAWADEFSEKAGLPSELRNDLALSGSLHDIGKADPRYQAYYAGGNPYGSAASEPLAKSGQSSPPNGAWERAGLPAHWRHEALSVRLAGIHPLFAQAHDPELVLWLIGTHHGYGRPLFVHADPKDAECRSGLLSALGVKGDLEAGFGPQSLAFGFAGLDWARIFERLRQRYGVWGLARLEAFVRLADHRASEHLAPPTSARGSKDAAPHAEGRGTNDKLRERFTGLRASKSEAGHRHRLEGLEPGNLLAFLALLGLLRALETVRPDWHPRAAWNLEVAPLRPFLQLREPLARRDLLNAVEEGIRKLAKAYDFGGLPKLKLSQSEARKRLIEAVQRAREGVEVSDKWNAEIWSALISDAAIRKDGAVVRTPFCLLDVAQTSFLKNLAEVFYPENLSRRDRSRSFLDVIEDALFSPWRREDETPSFRWDPTEDSRHAYRWAAPTTDKQGVEHGANMLAAVGLAVLSVAPIRRNQNVRLQVLGGDFSEDFSFAWPIWRDSASLSGIRGLLSHPDLRQRDAVAHLGVDHVRVSRRISPSGSKYANFTFAREVEATRIRSPEA